jgi:hypothetical protein
MSKRHLSIDDTEKVNDYSMNDLSVKHPMPSEEPTFSTNVKLYNTLNAD